MFVHVVFQRQDEPYLDIAAYKPVTILVTHRRWEKTSLTPIIDLDDTPIAINYETFVKEVPKYIYTSRELNGSDHFEIKPVCFDLAVKSGFVEFCNQWHINYLC